MELGFETFAYYGSLPQKQLFVLLRLPIEQLKAAAATIQFRMELDPDNIEVIARLKSSFKL